MLVLIDEAIRHKIDYVIYIIYPFRSHSSELTGSNYCVILIGSNKPIKGGHRNNGYINIPAAKNRV